MTKFPNPLALASPGLREATPQYRGGAISSNFSEFLLIPGPKANMSQGDIDVTESAAMHLPSVVGAKGKPQIAQLEPKKTRIPTIRSDWLQRAVKQNKPDSRSVKPELPAMQMEPPLHQTFAEKVVPRPHILIEMKMPLEETQSAIFVDETEAASQPEKADVTHRYVATAPKPEPVSVTAGLELHPVSNSPKKLDAQIVPARIKPVTVSPVRLEYTDASKVDSTIHDTPAENMDLARKQPSAASPTPSPKLHQPASEPATELVTTTGIIQPSPSIVENPARLASVFELMASRILAPIHSLVATLPQGRVADSIKIALHPAELGSIQIIVQRADDSVSVRIFADTDIGYSALLGERERIEDVLRDIRLGAQTPDNGSRDVLLGERAMKGGRRRQDAPGLDKQTVDGSSKDASPENPIDHYVTV